MKDTKVGKFEFKDGALYGPRKYFEEQGDKLLGAIENGTDIIFNMCAHQSPNLESAILVRLQTDYAGWLGMQEVLSWCK